MADIPWSESQRYGHFLVNFLELETKIQNLQLKNLLKVIKELSEQLSLSIMDSQNILYLIETLLDFETILSIKTNEDYSILLKCLFHLVKQSVPNLHETKYLIIILKK